jgi:uncharacterized repeat protein (TIGR01451 family)
LAYMAQVSLLTGATFRNLTIRRLLTSVLLFGLTAVGLTPEALAAGPYGATQCAGSRFGSNLGCTANDVSLNSITVAGTPPSSCVGGATLPLDLNVKINFGAPSRYDVGVFLSNNGVDPKLTSASSCSVAVLPLTLPFLNLDGDLCGDGNSTINGGTGSGSFVMTGVAVPCTTNGSGSALLNIPYVISWDQQATNYCGDNTYPVPGTSSKCNSGSVTFPAGATIIVLPALTNTDGVTTVIVGNTLTYTVTVTNSTASPLSNAVFTDPAVANLSVSSVSCVAAGGATCPASSTVAAMQGSGITLPNMPNTSTLTFTIVATLTAGTAGNILTNTANVTVSGQTNSASDADTIVNPVPTTTSISPSSVTAGSSSFTMTVNGTNFIPTSVVQIGGVSLTTTYVSATQVTVTIPSSYLTTAGTANITVVNPGPGGGTSNAQVFTVKQP